MRTYLHIGGLVAVGFDPTGAYLLTITHSGRGVFSTRTWERLARDTELAYPEAGVIPRGEPRVSGIWRSE